MEITCKFYSPKHYYFQNGYLGFVEKASKVSLNQELQKVDGTHEKRKSVRDVLSLFAISKPFGFVPKNLDQAFPNLQCLILQNCGLEKISRGDIRGLKVIRLINVSCNELTSLPDDLFADMKNLQHIYFNDNKLERMSSRLLLPIRHTLRYASFENNTKINEVFFADPNDYTKFTKFMQAIDSNCLPPESKAETAIAEFAKFRISGEFTDFTIVVRGREFKIHKVVLAAQSSVFKEIFAVKDGEPSKSFNNIKNFSEKTFESFLDYF